MMASLGKRRRGERMRAGQGGRGGEGRGNARGHASIYEESKTRNTAEAASPRPDFAVLAFAKNAHN